MRSALLSASALLAVVASPEIALAQAAAAPSLAQPATTDPFMVRPGDVLRIRVWPDSSLSGEFPIEETGYVYLPVLGRVEAGGRGLAELRAELRAAYAQAMKIPVVTVTPVFRVGVLGAVRRPGLYPVDPSHTLFDVISLAGGFEEDARTDEVRVIRGDRVLRVDAEEGLPAGDPIDLRSGDRIVVPERSSLFSLENLWRIGQIAVSIATLIAVSSN